MEPSTSTECSSAAPPKNSQGVHAEPKVSTSSECDPEVSCLRPQSINQSQVALEGPLKPTIAHQKSVSTHKFTSDVGCQINTRGAHLMMKSTESQTYKSSFDVVLCDQSTQTDENYYKEEGICLDEIGPSNE